MRQLQLEKLKKLDQSKSIRYCKWKIFHIPKMHNIQFVISLNQRKRKRRNLDKKVQTGGTEMLQTQPKLEIY